MLCPTCSKDSTHIHITAYGSIGCSNCMGFSETGGSQTDKILTRNSNRITDQQIQYEQDLITPYIIDKSTNKPIVNQDFVDLYPTQAAGTFSPEELKASGNETLQTVIETDTKEDIQFSGDEEEAISGILEPKESV